MGILSILVESAAFVSAVDVVPVQGCSPEPGGRQRNPLRACFDCRKDHVYGVWNQGAAPGQDTGGRIPLDQLSLETFPSYNVSFLRGYLITITRYGKGFNTTNNRHPHIPGPGFVLQTSPLNIPARIP